MNIWNKVFLGVIIATSIVVLALASVEMNVRNKGQKNVATLQENIKKIDGDIAKTRAGTAPAKPTTSKSLSELGVEELRNALHERYYERGREWQNCIFRRMEEVILPPALPQLKVELTITGPPDESGTLTNAASPEHLRGIVYVFAEGDTDITFLGRFSVDVATIQTTKFRDKEDNEKDGFMVTLISADTLSSSEVDHIIEATQDATRRSRWAVYLTQPVDRIAGIFDQLTEEEKQQISEELLERFQPRSMPDPTEEEKQDVSPNVLALWAQVRAAVDDPESESAHDPATTLDWLYLWRSTLLRYTAGVRVDIDTTKSGEAKTKAEIEKMTRDSVLEEKRVKAMSVQRDAVKALLEQYQAEIDRMVLQIEKLQTFNAALVAKIAEYQVTAVEEIEKRAANAVRSE